MADVLRRLLRRPPPVVDDPPVLRDATTRSLSRTYPVRNVVHARNRTGKVWHRVTEVSYTFVGDPMPYLAGHGRSYGFACRGSVFEHEPTEGSSRDAFAFVDSVVTLEPIALDELCRSCAKALADPGRS